MTCLPASRMKGKEREREKFKFSFPLQILSFCRAQFELSREIAAWIDLFRMQNEQQNRRNYLVNANGIKNLSWART